MNKTKQKVILSAIKLYNERGMVNVLNSDIAKDADISLSNFNYHFKTKVDLMLEICEYMRRTLKQRIADSEIITKQSNGLELSRVYFKFALEFRFFYFDTHNILHLHPDIEEEMHHQIQESINIIKNLHYLGIGMGHIKPEPEDFPGLYDHLAKQIFMNNHFWIVQSYIRGIESPGIIDGLNDLYAILYPYLTEKGRASYKEYIDGALKSSTKTK